MNLKYNPTNVTVTFADGTKIHPLEGSVRYKKPSEWERKRLRWLREAHEKIRAALATPGQHPLPLVLPNGERPFRFQRIGRIWRTGQL